MNQIISLTATVPVDLNHKRLDQTLSLLFPAYSRARLQKWIKSGFITVNNKLLRGKDKVLSGQILKINAPIVEATFSLPQPIALEIIYQDQDIIVINKPAGLVVHPGAGQKDNTLLNALLYKFPELKNLPRAGIIHRLDKNTSGLLVVARTLEAQTKLTATLQNRKITREYEAIVNGVMTSGGKIDAPIGRHKTKRTHMAVIDSGKTAITHYRVIKRFQSHTHIRLILETGRTHQIRVHLESLNYPIVGDPTYGSRVRFPAGCTNGLQETLKNFKRQALHAKRLVLSHPRTGKTLEFEAPLPQDMAELLEKLY